MSELHHDHPGMCKMKSIARSYIWWPGLDSSIESLVKSCQECQAVKSSPPVAPLQLWVWPSTVFQHVHVDFAGSLLLVVDAYSKWPYVTIMQSTTVNKTIEVLRELCRNFSLPEQIISDNGPQFISRRMELSIRGTPLTTLLQTG